MTMKGIDISDYQRGLDLTKIDYDFVFCKATEGIDKVCSTCDPFIQTAISQKKLYGFYHFLDQSDPVKQAEFFYANCKNYFGKGIPMLDYEAYGRIGTDKAKLFLDKIYELTGVRSYDPIRCQEPQWPRRPLAIGRRGLPLNPSRSAPGMSSTPSAQSHIRGYRSVGPHSIPSAGFPKSVEAHAEGSARTAK